MTLPSQGAGNPATVRPSSASLLDTLARKTLNETLAIVADRIEDDRSTTHAGRTDEQQGGWRLVTRVARAWRGNRIPRPLLRLVPSARRSALPRRNTDAQAFYVPVALADVETLEVYVQVRHALLTSNSGRS